MLQTLPLAEVHASAAFLNRARLTTVARYRAALEGGQDIPPVVVCPARQGYRLLEGAEQYLAAQQAGQSSLQATVQQRSAQEKRQAILDLLLSKEGQTYSDRLIGDYCAVDHKMVGRLRAELGMSRPAQVVVRRGQGLYTLNLPPRPQGSLTQTRLHDTPYLHTPSIPDQYADVILTVPPCGDFVPVAAHAERMARHLKADGTAYLWFSADDLDWLVVWQQALQQHGLSRCQLINWVVNMDLDTLDPEIFPRFEIILALSRQRRYQATTDLLRGARSASVQEPSQVYRKPLKLVSQLLTRHGEAVLLDPFVQSGVTLLGAQRSGLAQATGCLLDMSFAQEVRTTCGGITTTQNC
jgi:hypothetical protein